jgi:hypothetical protein
MMTMLALSPEGHQDDPVVERFLMLLVRDISCGREECPGNREDGPIRCFSETPDGRGGFQSLRDGP